MIDAVIKTIDHHIKIDAPDKNIYPMNHGKADKIRPTGIVKFIFSAHSCNSIIGLCFRTNLVQAYNLVQVCNLDQYRVSLAQVTNLRQYGNLCQASFFNMLRK